MIAPLFIRDGRSTSKAKVKPSHQGEWAAQVGNAALEMGVADWHRLLALLPPRPASDRCTKLVSLKLLGERAGHIARCRCGTKSDFFLNCSKTLKRTSTPSDLRWIKSQCVDSAAKLSARQLSPGQQQSKSFGS